MNQEVLVKEEQVVHLLLLEDDDADYQFINRQLMHGPTKFEVSRAETLKDACEYLERNHFDLVISDLRLPDCLGLETVTTLKEHCGNAILLVMTGVDDEKVEHDVLDLGARGYFVKGEVQGRTIMRTILHFLRCERYARKHLSLVEHLRMQQSSLEAFSQRLNEENQLLRNIHELRHASEPISFKHLSNRLSKDAIAIMAMEAEQASRAKSEFLVTVCHELRTALESILSIHDHLTKSDLTNQQKALIGTSLANTTTLYRMIDEMSEIARIESGRAKGQEFPCDLAALTKEVASTAMPLLSSKHINLKWSCDESFSELALCDGKMIRQILILLLSNAIKFTAQGHIEIQGTTLSKDRSAGRLRIMVSDTGVGVPPDMLEALRVAFSKGGLHPLPPMLNPSLGLSLALRMTRLLGGELGVESQRRQGSRFWIDVPVRYPDQASDNRLDNGNQGLPKGPKFLHRRSGMAQLNGNRNPSPPVEGHVLIGHESRPLQLYLVEQLRQLGYSAETAKDGGDVMYLLGKKKFDLLMIDCHLPVHDAFVIANRMKSVIKRHENDRLPRLIAISDRLMVDNLEVSPADNIDAFLTIPLEISRLRDTIQRCQEVAR